MSKNSIREELRAKWRSAADTVNAGAEWRAIALSVSAPVKLLAAIREPDQRIALLVETPLSNAPRQIHRMQSQAVSLTDQRRPDEGIMRLAITLERDASMDVFEVLAADLADVASESTTAVLGTGAVLRRLEAWQACLRAHRSGLSSEEEIGLFGELYSLRALAEDVGFPHAIDAWKGPLDGLHDFSRSGTHIEVKTVLGSGSQIRISRLDQLESSGLRHLVIVRPRLRENPEGSSVADLAGEVRTDIARTAPELLSDFDELLLRAGLSQANAGANLLIHAVLENMSFYVVVEGFPRLTLSSVPAGIIDGSYLIDERAAAPFAADRARASILFKTMSEVPSE